MRVNDFQVLAYKLMWLWQWFISDFAFARFSCCENGRFWLFTKVSRCEIFMLYRKIYSICWFSNLFVWTLLLMDIGIHYIILQTFYLLKMSRWPISSWSYFSPCGCIIDLLCACPFSGFKGVLHPWTLFLKTLCIFSKNKATSDKVSYGSGQKCSKELKNHSFTSVETIDVKLQWKMCENQYFPCFEP